MTPTPPTPMGGREVYFRLLGHVKAYWRPFAVAIFAMAVLGATEPAIPALLQAVVNSFESRNLDIVPWCAAGLIGLFLLRGLATFTSVTGLAAVASRLVAQPARAHVRQAADRAGALLRRAQHGAH